MGHQIKYDTVATIGQISNTQIKKNVEFKYPGHKVTDVFEYNGIIFAEFEPEIKNEYRKYIK